MLQLNKSYLSRHKAQLTHAKLKAISKTSALLSGFTMIAMVEIQINKNKQIPSGIFIVFVICTTLLVAIHMLGLMFGTCVLANIDTYCNLQNASLEHDSLHERLHWYVETTWMFSTLLGVVLFLLEFAIICLMQFYDLSQPAAWSTCIILTLVFIISLVFAIRIYRTLTKNNFANSDSVSSAGEIKIFEELRVNVAPIHVDKSNDAIII